MYIDLLATADRRYPATIGKIEMSSDCPNKDTYSNGFVSDRIHNSSNPASDNGTKKINVLLFSSGVGGGHTSPALAIAHAFKKHPLFNVTYTHAKLENNGRDSRCTRMRNAIDWHLRNTNLLWKRYTYPRSVKKLRSLVDDAESAVREVKPDVIIATHHWAGQFLRDALKKTGSDAALIRVVTDFGRVNREWFDTNPRVHDVWALPSADSLTYALSRGVPTTNMVVTGYPVRPEFSSKQRAHDLRKTLSLPQDRIITLVMAGSIGTSKTRNMVQEMLRSMRTSDRLTEESHIVVIAGKNEKSKRSLEDLAVGSRRAPKKPSLEVFGFIANVAEYMIASDIILTKSGGSTVAEILQVGKPYILYDRLSPTEQGNINHTISRHTGIVALHGPRSASKQWKKLAGDATLRERMVQAQSFSRRDGADNVVALAHQVVATSRSFIA